MNSIHGVRVIAALLLESWSLRYYFHSNNYRAKLGKQHQPFYNWEGTCDNVKYFGPTSEVIINDRPFHLALRSHLLCTEALSPGEKLFQRMQRERWSPLCSCVICCELWHVKCGNDNNCLLTIEALPDLSEANVSTLRRQRYDYRCGVMRRGDGCYCRANNCCSLLGCYRAIQYFVSRCCHSICYQWYETR